MVRIINGEVVSDHASLSRRTSAHSTPRTTPGLGLASTPSGTMPTLSLENDSTPPLSGESNLSIQSPHPPSYASSMHHSIHHPSTSPPPPLALSAQYTNPYLSHTTYGLSPLTSGHGFETDDVNQQQAQVLAAYYQYPYLQGFLGPGFILGQAQVHSPTMNSNMSANSESSSSLDPSSTSSSASSPLPVLPVHPPSSSFPSPLLTSTSERRKSKPHVQFIPPTHSLAPNGLVLPVIQPQNGTNAAASTETKRRSSARVSHAFNLFGLPPILIYEIPIPPHVYLLTGFILYMIGPPALIPLVVCFFFYRWHLQRQSRSSSAQYRSTLQPIDHPSKVSSLPSSHSHSHVPTASNSMTSKFGSTGTQPNGLPPKPTTTQRRHPNIHSLYD